MRWTCVCSVSAGATLQLELEGWTRPVFSALEKCVERKRRKYIWREEERQRNLQRWARNCGETWQSTGNRYLHPVVCFIQHFTLKSTSTDWCVGKRETRLEFIIIIQGKKHRNNSLMISKSINVNFPAILGVLPGLVEAWTRPQAEFGLLPAIRSLWCGFKPSVSKECRAGQRHCSTRRPRDGFIVLSPDKAWEERRRDERTMG